MLTHSDQELLSRLGNLGSIESLEPTEAFQIVWPLALQLMEREGYTIHGPDSLGLTRAIAVRDDPGDEARIRTGLLYKHYGRGRPVGPNWLRQFDMAMRTGAIDRGVLVTNGRLSVEEEVFRNYPIEMSVLDQDSIHQWAERIRTEAGSVHAGVHAAVRDFSKQLARRVAEDPHALAHIEWRDLERMMATVFESFGFKVELTPGSKDGGKDIVLQCLVADENHSYAVEIKHWQSGKRVGPKLIRQFIRVIVREQHHGGLYLATGGYSADAVEVIAEVGQQRLELGKAADVTNYCRLFSKLESGLWSPPDNVVELIFPSAFHLP
jgi:restriction system protein